MKSNGDLGSPRFVVDDGAGCDEDEDDDDDIDDVDDDGSRGQTFKL